MRGHNSRTRGYGHSEDGRETIRVMYTAQCRQIVQSTASCAVVAFLLLLLLPLPSLLHHQEPRAECMLSSHPRVSQNVHKRTLLLGLMVHALRAGYLTANRASSLTSPQPTVHSPQSTTLAHLYTCVSLSHLLQKTLAKSLSKSNSPRSSNSSSVAAPVAVALVEGKGPSKN